MTDTWADGIRSVAAESGGALSIWIVRPFEALELFAVAAATGDPEAGRLARAVVDHMAHVQKRGTGPAAVLCATCNVKLAQSAFSCVLATPRRDDPTKAIALGVCFKCGIEPDAIEARAFQALRRIFPDGRRVAMQGHAGGQA